MPIVSFRVTAEVHESLIKLAEKRNQTLTALMQETTAHIVERTQAPPAFVQQGPPVRTYVAEGPTALATTRPLAKDPEPGTWGAKAAYGARLKKDKGSK